MAHMHYKGTGKVHSFRGLLTDGDQRKIRIQGPVGAIAWRVTKFQLFPSAPGTANYEATVQIWREEQTSVSTDTADVNFTSDELLGAALYIADAGFAGNNNKTTSVFDNELFSRNIYVTHTGTSGSSPINYYIELEEVKVSKPGMAQLAVAAARRTID